jgi:hypothetical protein
MDHISLRSQVCQQILQTKFLEWDLNQSLPNLKESKITVKTKKAKKTTHSTDSTTKK